MSFEEFIEKVKSAGEEKTGQGITVSISRVTRNNGTKQTVLELQNHMFRVKTMISLEGFWDRFRQGTDFEEIMDDLMNRYQEALGKKNIDTRVFYQWDLAKDNVIYRVINAERNKAYLTKIPHKKFLDLAVIFSLQMENGELSAVINNHLMEMWDVGVEELLNAAKNNTERLLGSCVENINTLFSLSSDAKAVMYLVSNTDRSHGAVSMFYQEPLARIAEEVGSDLYILPSSIHEVLVVPIDEEKAAEEYAQMVKHVNRTAVLEDEVLSDHVYIYNRDNGDIEIAA